MNPEELPGDLKETIGSLKHGSHTIECEVNDALENPESLKDFLEHMHLALWTKSANIF